MRYLLDTNIISDLVRHPQGRVFERIREIGDGAVCTSVIVASELRYGAAKKGAPALSARVEAILGVLAVEPLEPPADALYGALRARLEKLGRSIGGNDLLIAAHALALGCVLVTDNVTEFGRIDDLPHENWLR